MRKIVPLQSLTRDSSALTARLESTPRRVEGDIPIDLTVDYGSQFLFISRDQRKYTHAIHKYPAKFFPELPRWLIQKYSHKGEVVLDPFMGSGTTNLEALLLGRRTIGVDVDPFSRMLARAKTTPISHRTLKSAQQYLTDYLHDYRPNSYLADIPSFPYRDNWFTHTVLKELSYIKNGIESEFKGKVKEFLLITFSSIIRKVSQADNQCTRTVIRKSRPKHIKEGDPIELFLKRLADNISGMTEYHKDVGNQISIDIPSRASATDLSKYPKNSIDLAVTSPPYVNAVDYPRTHQLEMYWLGLATGSLRDYKVQHVGTEVVSAEEYRTLALTGISSADEVIRKIYQADNRRAFIASKYIKDMIKNMREVHRVLKQGGRYVIVVGSNTIRSHTFENWRYLQDAAPTIGFEVEGVFISKIINHFISIPRDERINDDYVLVLKK